MSKEIRFLVMWPDAAPYLVGCLKSLLSEYNVRLLLIVAQPGDSQAYLELKRNKNSILIDISSPHASSAYNIEKIIIDFSPHIALITMKRYGLFARSAKIIRQTGGLVIGANDHYWKNSWRDYANAIAARFGIFKSYDVVLVAGALGRIYARHLGFQNSRIFEGVYSCEAQLFRPVGEARFASENKTWPKAFVFVGQFIPRKGLNTLIKAYAKYRDSALDPWDLWCIGKGPLSHLLENLAGVRNMGYMSSEECSQMMGKAGAFILPSLEEHWGVVIHEAACAGLPIIATHECGACVELVRNGYNGFTFPANDSNRLAQLMRYISDNGKTLEMGRNSLRMSYQIDPKLWAKRLIEDIYLSTKGQSIIN